MIKIGLVNLDTTHPLAFSEYMQKGNRARYSAIYNDSFRDDEEIEAFMRKYTLEKRCRSIEELVDSVDIGFVQSCDWNNHLKQAMPFIECNKPVFIDKPIVGSLADCRKLEALAKEGAVILGSSSVRYAQEVTGFLNRPEEERGKIMNIYGTAGVDEFNYGIHIVEAIGGLVGRGAVSAGFVGRSRQEGKTCETFFVRFNDGLTATYTTFQELWQPFEVVVTTTESTYHFQIDTGKIYGELLDRICDYMETGRNALAPMEELTESVKIMLAGRISRETGEAEIKLSEIPEDDPGYDGDAFARDYAVATNPRMYVENCG
ncbi:MAG: Gfo/Idh/MocA family oxidoreductase [bacterium]